MPDIFDEPAVIRLMQEQVRQWELESDRRSIFLSCYLLMTRNMLAALDAGEFNDRVWVGELLRHFAGYYFKALAAYEQQSPATPPVWQVAFAAARRPQTMVLQNLLLGVNAHINYDLVLTLVDLLDAEWASLPPSRSQQCYADYCHVNEIIGRTIDAVQDEIIERAAPVMDVLDKLLGPVDEWLTSRLINRWREEVWQFAVRLLAVSEPTGREEIRRQVEAAALKRASAILLE